jgi:peptidoglycan L-alanyl-D-glutamate endopeptidase CwlK
MISSRQLADLALDVRVKAQSFLDECKESGIDVLVTCTYRDNEAQAALYAQGRTAPGAIVTDAPAGMSAHNYRRAFDVVPMRNGKCVWGISAPEDSDLWHRLGAIGQQCGLEWAGTWVHFKEFPHFQDLAGKSIADWKAEYDQANGAKA